MQHLRFIFTHTSKRFNELYNQKIAVQLKLPIEEEKSCKKEQIFPLCLVWVKQHLIEH